VRPRRAWFVFASTAVVGTIAAALLPSPWSIVCGVLAALGAIGAFVMFVVIVVLEDRDSDDAGGSGEDHDEGRRAGEDRGGPGPRRPVRPRGRGHR
jgi:hypothetical protein